MGEKATGSATTFGGLYQDPSIASGIAALIPLGSVPSACHQRCSIRMHKRQSVRGVLMGHACRQIIVSRIMHIYMRSQDI